MLDAVPWSCHVTPHLSHVFPRDESRDSRRASQGVYGPEPQQFPRFATAARSSWGWHARSSPAARPMNGSEASRALSAGRTAGYGRSPPRKPPTRHRPASALKPEARATAILLLVG